MAKKKLNVLLIASHHGFFLTLKSIERFKKDINNLIVVIPDEKIEKYSQMEGEMFKNFRGLILEQTKAVKKSAKVYTAKFDVFKRVSQTADFLREIQASGIWLEVCAGSVLNRMPSSKTIDEMTENLLLMSSNRCYEGIKQLDMYMMAGQPTGAMHEKQNTDSFIINADKLPTVILPDHFMIKESMQRGTFKSTNPHAFSNEEELVDLAFAGKQLIEHATKASDCVVCDYWSIAMSPTTSIDRIYAYPLELYLPFVDACKGLIPAVTLERIRQNATESKEYSLAFRDALS